MKMLGMGVVLWLVALPVHGDEGGHRGGGCLYVNPEAGFVLPAIPGADGTCEGGESSRVLPKVQVHPGTLEECLAHMSDLFGDPGVTRRRLVGMGDNGFVYGISFEGVMGGKVYPEHVFMAYDFSPEKRKAKPCVVLGFSTGRPLAPEEASVLRRFRWIPLGMARLPGRARRAAGAYMKKVWMITPFGYSDRFYVGGRFRVWSPRRCPGCIVQIVVGYQEQPLGCLYDGKPGPFPGVTGRNKLTFPLPPGEEPFEPIDVRYKVTLAYTCEQAMEMYRSAPPPPGRRLPHTRQSSAARWLFP